MIYLRLNISMCFVTGGEKNCRDSISKQIQPLWSIVILFADINLYYGCHILVSFSNRKLIIILDFAVGLTLITITFLLEKKCWLKGSIQIRKVKGKQVHLEREDY